MLRRSTLILAASLAVLSAFEPSLAVAAVTPSHQEDIANRPRFIRKNVRRFVWLNETESILQTSSVPGTAVQPLDAEVRPAEQRWTFTTTASSSITPAPLAVPSVTPTNPGLSSTLPPIVRPLQFIADVSSGTSNSGPTTLSAITNVTPLQNSATNPQGSDVISAEAGSSAVSGLTTRAETQSIGDNNSPGTPLLTSQISPATNTTLSENPSQDNKVGELTNTATGANTVGQSQQGSTATAVGQSQQANAVDTVKDANTVQSASVSTSADKNIIPAILPTSSGLLEILNSVGVPLAASVTLGTGPSTAPAIQNLGTTTTGTAVVKLPDAVNTLASQVDTLINNPAATLTSAIGNVVPKVSSIASNFPAPVASVLPLSSIENAPNAAISSAASAVGALPPVVASIISSIGPVIASVPASVLPTNAGSVVPTIPVVLPASSGLAALESVIPTGIQSVIPSAIPTAIPTVIPTAIPTIIRPTGIELNPALSSLLVVGQTLATLPLVSVTDLPLTNALPTAKLTVLPSAMPTIPSVASILPSLVIDGSSIPNPLAILTATPLPTASLPVTIPSLAAAPLTAQSGGLVLPVSQASASLASQTQAAIIAVESQKSAAEPLILSASQSAVLAVASASVQNLQNQLAQSQAIVTPTPVISKNIPTDVKGPFTQQPTGYNQETTQVLPTSIAFAASTSPPPAATGTESYSGPTGLPSNLPLVLYPPTGPVKQPENTELIQIGFLYPLNYDFVYHNTIAQRQIFGYLPRGIAYALNIAESNITMQTLRAWDTTQDLHYITTLALAWVPSHLVDPLGLAVTTSSSTFYNNPDSSVRTLISMVNSAIPIRANNETETGLPTGTDDRTDNTAQNGAAPVGGGIGNQSPVKASSVGIGVGVVCGAAAYGAAMFFVARRYRRRRQSHARSSSILSVTPQMSHLGPDSAAGAALMSGAMGGERSISPYYDRAESRGSEHSGGSSGRQQISAPIMAENSLGWN